MKWGSMFVWEAPLVNLGEAGYILIRAPEEPDAACTLTS